MNIWLQKSASIQPGTSPLNYWKNFQMFHCENARFWSGSPVKGRMGPLIRSTNTKRSMRNIHAAGHALRIFFRFSLMDTYSRSLMKQKKENTFTVRTTSSDRCVFRNFSWMIGSGPGNAGKSMLTARICQPMWVCLAAVAVAHAGAGAAHANLDIRAGIWISLCWHAFNYLRYLHWII